MYMYLAPCFAEFVCIQVGAVNFTANMANVSMAIWVYRPKHHLRVTPFEYDEDDGGDGDDDDDDDDEDVYLRVY